MSDLIDQGNERKIVADMKTVVADAEEILRETAGVAGDKAHVLREHMGDRLRSAKLRIADAEAAVLEKAKAAACSADHCVRENPWESIGVAAAVGLLLGVLIGRR